MPLRLEIKKELSAKSDRVKSVDIYPAEHPWVLSALYNGKVIIHDYSTNSVVKSFELCEVPVRCAKFIIRKQWIIAGTDDMLLRVYNYNTMEKVKEWEAHTDYIRFVEIHPNRPLIFSSSDDMTIKLWDWEKDFECVQVYEGHVHYVMMVKVNPRDTNTFASASLDRSIKVWGVTAGTAHFSLEGHERGVNCLDYYPGGDKPYLLSGADDRTVKIWDYQTKACLQTLDGHTHNVAAVCFHPRLPLIISASEDGTVRLWHSTTYRPESTLNYGLERAWALAPTKDANKLAIGYDEGTIVLKLGNEKPVASLDTNSGKLIWAQGHDIQTIPLRGLCRDGEVQDGEKLSLSPRDLGSCEVYPQSVAHNSNGSFICVCGDGEYIIYTSQALRNKAFGSALDFVWSSSGSGDYAIRESISKVRTFKNFKDHKQLLLPMSSADGLFGGSCLGVKGADCVVFFDWESGDFIQKIDVQPTHVIWNETGEQVALVCEDSYFVLRFNREVVQRALSEAHSKGASTDEGVDGSFELQETVSDKIRTGQWVGDCFLYSNSSGKVNYFVGGEVLTLCHLNYPMYLLGFVSKEDRVFLIDKAYNVVSYKLLNSVLNYQTAVVRGEMEIADALLPSIPKTELNSVARFLESQGYKREALEVSSDPDHKFELAVDLKDMATAHRVLLEGDRREEDSTEAQSRWRRLGDLALAQGDIDLAQQCASLSGDLSGLLLLHTASANREGMASLALQAREAGRMNVAFIAFFVTGQIEQCIQLLVDSGRVPEAAFLARTYMPSMIPSVLELWREDLRRVNEKAADALADPVKYPNLFTDFEWTLKVEKLFKAGRGVAVPASSYPSAKAELELDLVALAKENSLSEEQEGEGEREEEGEGEVEVEGEIGEEENELLVEEVEEDPLEAEEIDVSTPPPSSPLKPQPSSPTPPSSPLKPSPPSSPIQSSVATPPSSPKPTQPNSKIDFEDEEEEDEEEDLDQVLRQADSILHANNSGKQNGDGEEDEDLEDW